MVKGITVPLEQLCLRAKEIWQGDFTKTNVSYDLYELENLRTEMNHMAEQLKRSQEIQKDFFQNVSHELRNSGGLSGPRQRSGREKGNPGPDCFLRGRGSRSWRWRIDLQSAGKLSDERPAIRNIRSDHPDPA